MHSKRSIKKLLKDLDSKKVTVKKAYQLLKDLPYKNMDFARLDHHRIIRKGFGEAVYCEGKTHQHVKKILEDILKRDGYILFTRADKKLYEFLKIAHPKLKYNELARIIYLKKRIPKNKKIVLILTAGTSDIPVAEEAKLTLEVMGSRVKAIYDVGVAGIHRLFDKASDIYKANVIIVAAIGGEVREMFEIPEF